MKPRIQIESIVFVRNDAEGSDGYVTYLITHPCTERPCQHVCESHPQRDHMYMRQGFRRGSVGHRENGTPEEKASNQANLWGWDGNESAPTLSPSYVCVYPREGGEAIRVHLFLNSGKIDLCGDSTVEVESNHVACRHRHGEGPE